MHTQVLIFFLAPRLLKQQFTTTFALKHHLFYAISSFNTSLYLTLGQWWANFLNQGPHTKIFNPAAGQTPIFENKTVTIKP